MDFTISVSPLNRFICHSSLAISLAMARLSAPTQGHHLYNYRYYVCTSFNLDNYRGDGIVRLLGLRCAPNCNEKRGMKLYRRGKLVMTAQDIQNLQYIEALQSKSSQKNKPAHGEPLVGIQSSLFLNDNQRPCYACGGTLFHINRACQIICSQCHPEPREKTLVGESMASPKMRHSLRRNKPTV